MGAEWWGRGPATESPIWTLGSGRTYLSYTRIMVQQARAERRRQGARGVQGGPRALAEELGSMNSEARGGAAFSERRATERRKCRPETRERTVTSKRVAGRLLS